MIRLRPLPSTPQLEGFAKSPPKVGGGPLKETEYDDEIASSKKKGVPTLAFQNSKGNTIKLQWPKDDQVDTKRWHPSLLLSSPPPA